MQSVKKSNRNAIKIGIIFLLGDIKVNVFKFSKNMKLKTLKIKNIHIQPVKYYIKRNLGSIMFQENQKKMQFEIHTLVTLGLYDFAVQNIGLKTFYGLAMCY